MTGPPATIRTACPHCRALLSVAAEFAGRPVACGRCRQVFPAEPVAEPPTRQPRPSGSGGSGNERWPVEPPPRSRGSTRGERRRYEGEFDARPRRRRRRRRSGDGPAVASLVLAVVALVFFCVFPVSLLTGSVGAYFGAVGLKSSRRPMAVTGLTLSLVGIVFGVGFTVLFMAGVVKSVADTPRLGPTRNNPTFNSR